jgi:hypothetical protein
MRSKLLAPLGVLILALLIGLASATGLSAAVSGQPAAPTASAMGAFSGVHSDPFMRTELYFGSERPNKPEVSDAEFKQFLDEEITPRFPDGLTVLKGFGQFREGDGTIIQESSFVLILLYPRETLRDSSAKVEQIRALYLERFGQESVLRVDDPLSVRVSF